MELVLNNNIHNIDSIMKSRGVWEKIAKPDWDIKTFKPVMPENAVIIEAIIDGILIGVHVFVFEKGNAIYHTMLLKEFRRFHGREFFKRGIKWFFDNTNYDTLDAEITKSHVSTINLAKHFDFKEIGQNEQNTLLRLDR